jgi:hypothetical protein
MASPDLLVFVAMASAATSIPGPTVGKEWWKLDLEDEVGSVGVFLHQQDTRWLRSRDPISRWSYELRSTL